MSGTNPGSRRVRRKTTLFQSIAPMVMIAVLALAACSSDDDSAADTAAATGSVGSTPSASPSTGLSGSDEQRIASYRLSMDRVEKWGEAIKNLQNVAENDPDVRRWAERNDANATSIRNMEQTLESSPKIRRAIEQAGISAEDFVLTQLALLQAAMVVGLQKGGITQVPPNVSEDNVKFYRDNEAKLTRLLEGLQEKDG